MTARHTIAFALLAAVATVLAGCPGHTRAARQLQLDSFDRAWTRVHEVYPDPTMNGVDWEATREQFRPRAEEATTAGELRPILEEMFALLDTSHLEIISGDLQDTLAEAAESARKTVKSAVSDSDSDSDSDPDSDPDSDSDSDSDPDPDPDDEEDDDGFGYGDVGLQLRLVGDQVLVTDLDPDGPAAAAGVELGWAVTSIGELDVVAFVDRVAEYMPDARDRELRVSMLATGALMGKAGRDLSLSLLDHGDQPLDLAIERRPPPREPVGFGHLPPTVVHSRDALLDEGRVGFLWFDAFLMPAPQLYTDAMLGFIEAGVDGVVLDLRGNPGGLVGMVRGMAGHLVGDKTSLGTMIYRDPTFGSVNLELRVAPRPASQRFDGPVAILVDRITVSTGEVFAAGLQGIDRARVFGVRTPGMAMPSIIEELPNGDSLQMPMGESLDPAGGRLEKDGVVPDQEIALTREAFAGGRDPVLDAALAWLADQRAPAEDGPEQPADGDAPPATEDSP